MNTLGMTTKLSMEKIAPAVSMRQQRFMGAELRRARDGEETVTGMSVKKLKEHARIPKKKRGKLPETVKPKKAEIIKHAIFMQADLLKAFGRGEITMKQFDAEHDRRARAQKKTASVSCPVCGAQRVMTCRCRIADSKCASGHEWHYKQGQIVIGPSPHAQVRRRRGMKSIVDISR